MKYKLWAMLIGVIGQLLLCFASFAPAQSDQWLVSIQAGDAAEAQGQYADAERAYREAVKLSEKFRERDPRIAVGLIKLAEVCRRQSRHDEAVASATRSLRALEKAMEEPTPKDPSAAYYKAETSAMIFDKADGIFVAAGKYLEAESVCKKLIAIREQAARPPKTSPKSNDDFLKFMGQVLTDTQGKVADAYDKLAQVYFAQRKFEEAEPLYTKSLRVREVAYGQDKPPAAVALSNLATLYAAQGRFEKAEPLYAHAVRIFQQTDWMDKPEVANTLENYSLVLRKSGREAEAAEMLEKAKAIRAKLQQSNH